MTVDQIPFLQEVYGGNTVEAYLWALALFAASCFTLIVFQKIVLGQLKRLSRKTVTKTDDYTLQLCEKTLVPVFYAGAFYFASTTLALSSSVEKLVTAGAILTLFIQATRFLIGLSAHVVENQMARRNDSYVSRKSTRTTIAVIKVVIWGVGVVMILDNLGFNVSAVIAGLGIGGVAIALAAQTILGDLFNYFVIFFDKPFEEGDFIITGEHMGVVERIGVKSTRIRSLGGEQLVFSNSDLTGSRIRNYKRMNERRVVFGVGVTYQTPFEKMKILPGIIREAVEGVENTRFDRAHFKEYGDSSLNFEVVYYVLSADYNKYMDIQQAINLKIFERFAAEGVDFAYPTRTLYLNNVSV